jgi:hypothetical protein
MLRDTMIASVPPRPPCPPWCRTDACQLRYEPGDGWVGTHGDALEMVTAGEAWWAVQLQQFVSPTKSTPAGISVDTVANALDWLTADQADRLALTLLSAAARLRTAA